MLLHRPPRSAVEVAGEGGPLQEAAAGHPRLEIGTRQEEVVLPVDLSDPRGAGGGRHRQPELRMTFQHP